MNHSNAKTTLSVLLLLAALGAMNACGSIDDNNETTETTDALNQTAETDAEDTVLDNLPALDFGGSEVRILHFGLEKMGGHDSSDWYEDKGNNIHTAVYERDLATEERLGVDLVYTTGSDDWQTYPGEVQKLVASGDCPYEMIFMESSQCFRLSLDGYFREVSDLQYIDIEQPWWYKDFMDHASISTDKRYMLTGAFSVSTLEGGSCTVFNKTIYNNYFENYNELYDLVEEHKWTYDVFLSLCRDVYKDVNGDGTADAGDLYGIFNRGGETINYASMSTGLSYLKRDENGLPVLDLYNEDSARWVEKLCELLYENNISYKNTDINGIEHFAGGNALFFLGWLSEYTSDTVRNMNDPYGVLPMPVLDEGMDYVSAAGTVNGQSAVIPVTTDTSLPEMCSATLESLSVEAYRTVIPAWYEVALKSKYADTARDSDMIDIIYNTLDTSFIMIADKLLGTGSFFTNMLGSKQRDPGEFASYYEKQDKSFQTKWAKMLESFAELDS